MTAGYPRSFDNIQAWSNSNGVPFDQARIRFAQYAVLLAIASVRQFRNSFVFKGGNALDFVWMPNRSTVDLDFSFDPSGPGFDFNIETISSLLNVGLSTAERSTGMTLALHRVLKKPPGDDRTFSTYVARIGYALPDELKLITRLLRSQPSPQVVQVEISINEAIGEATTFAVDETHDLRICTLEDIVAEKLRALLQQQIRNRTRCQDLLDIAVILDQRHALDRANIAEFLLAKAAARNVPATRVAFHNPELAARARVGYDELTRTARVRFIPFEEAWTALIAFVDELAIPENA